MYTPIGLAWWATIEEITRPLLPQNKFNPVQSLMMFFSAWLFLNLSSQISIAKGYPIDTVFNDIAVFDFPMAGSPTPRT